MAIPYQTDEQIKARYANQYNAYKDNLTAQANRQKSTTNSQADTAQKENYVSYMQNQKELPDLLARQGITGGATETSLLKGQTNYQNNYNANEKTRQSNLASIDNTLSDNLNSYKMTADENMASELVENNNKRIAYQQAQQEKTEARYANQIGSWNNQQIDNAIKALQAEKKAGNTANQWKLSYLSQQRAINVKEAKAEALNTHIKTIGRFNTIEKCQKAIADYRKRGMNDYANYVEAHMAELMAEGQQASGGGYSSGYGRSSYYGGGGSTSASGNKSSKKNDALDKVYALLGKKKATPLAYNAQKQTLAYRAKK